MTPPDRNVDLDLAAELQAESEPVAIAELLREVPDDELRKLFESVQAVDYGLSSELVSALAQDESFTDYALLGKITEAAGHYHAGVLNVLKRQDYDPASLPFLLNKLQENANATCMWVGEHVGKDADIDPDQIQVMIDNFENPRDAQITLIWLIEPLATHASIETVDRFYSQIGKTGYKMNGATMRSGVISNLAAREEISLAEISAFVENHPDPNDQAENDQDALLSGYIQRDAIDMDTVEELTGALTGEAPVIKHVRERPLSYQDLGRRHAAEPLALNTNVDPARLETYIGKIIDSASRDQALRDAALGLAKRGGVPSRIVAIFANQIEDPNLRAQTSKFASLHLMIRGGESSAQGLVERIDNADERERLRDILPIGKRLKDLFRRR